MSDGNQAQDYERVIEENKQATRQLRDCLLQKFAYFESLVSEEKLDSAVDSGG